MRKALQPPLRVTAGGLLEANEGLWRGIGNNALSLPMHRKIERVKYKHSKFTTRKDEIGQKRRLVHHLCDPHRCISSAEMTFKDKKLYWGGRRTESSSAVVPKL